MTTLRDVWIAQGMNSVQVAAESDCSIPLLYRLNRKNGEENGVAYGTVKRVCKTLNLTLDAFESLDACPDADKHRQRPARKRKKE